jgi:hypothetical protein
MIPVSIEPHRDLQIVVGCRVTSSGVLPLPEWPMAHDAPIALAECTISRWYAPTAKPSFQRATPGYVRLDPVPGATPEGPALLPRSFGEWLFDRLPTQGPVESTDPTNPAYPRLLERAKVAIRDMPPLPAGSNTEAGVLGAKVTYLVELLSRCLALPREEVFGIVRRLAIACKIPDSELRDRIKRTTEKGFSRPGAMRDQIVADFEAEQAIHAKEQERIAEAKRRATELVDFDLAREGLCAVTSDDDACPFKGFYKSAGLPIGDHEISIPYRQRDGETAVADAFITANGNAKMTRNARAAVGDLSDEIVRRLRELRKLTIAEAQYNEGHFTRDARTLEGRHALQQMRSHAYALVVRLAVAPRGDLAAWVTHLLLTLPVAYGGRVNLDNAIDAVQTALRDYVSVATRGHTHAYSHPGGRTIRAPLNDTAWPMGLMHPDTVPAAMLRELAKGSPWLWGEAYRAPTPAETQRLRVEIEPNLWDTTVAKAIDGRTDLRSQEIYEALRAEGLIASDTPNAEQRGRVSAALLAAGFARTEGIDAEGKRFRAWQRRAPDVAA